MYDKKTLNEIKRLDFEDFIWVVFATLSLINIYGDYNQKEYLKTHDNKFESNSNKIFEITLIVTILIYIYFFVRNCRAYKQISNNEKELYLIKVFGSAFVLFGSLLLIYFQEKQKDFIGTPAI